MSIRAFFRSLLPKDRSLGVKMIDPALRDLFLSREEREEKRLEKRFLETMDRLERETEKWMAEND